MDIKCTVEGQKLTIISPRPLPQGSDNFDRFLFTFSEDWDGLMVFAQFRQGDMVSNEYLTDVTVDGQAYQAATVPDWLVPGLATMTLYGTGREDVIGTTNYVVMRVQATGFMGEDVTSDLTETLYQQMVNRFIAYEWRYDIVRDFQGAWKALLSSIDSPGNTWTELPVTAAKEDEAPADPAVGDYWWDTDNSLLKKYVVTEGVGDWVTITGRAAEATAPPDVYYYYDTAAGKLYRTPITAIPVATPTTVGGIKLDPDNFRIGNTADDGEGNVGKLYLADNIYLKGNVFVQMIPGSEPVSAEKLATETYVNTQTGLIRNKTDLMDVDYETNAFAFPGDVYANEDKKLATEEYTEAKKDEAREEYTSVYGNLVPGVTWERGNISSDGSAPVVGNSTKWMRTADFISAEYRLALAFANTPRRLLAQVFFYSSAAVAGYIGKSANIYAPTLIDCPEGTTHIKVALTTYDWDTTDGITGAMFPLYAKRVWITYANLSLLKKVTDQIDTKTDKSTTQTAVSILNSSYGNLTALTLESGYCDSDTGIEKTNTKRLRTGFLPFDDNLVIVNKSYTGTGKYIQGFVTLYTAGSYPEETPESIYIVRISGDKPAWTNLANNFLNLQKFAWYNPKYFRLSLQWSDGTTLTEQDVIDTVLLGRQDNGQIAEIVRGRSGADLLFSADDVKIDPSDPDSDPNTYPMVVSPGTRPVLIDIESSYTLAGGMAITPVKAELYPDCASDVAIETLNTNTSSITTYYLCATNTDDNISEEVNGRLKISATAGGEAIGWINSCHAKLPKLNPLYYSTVKTGDGPMVYGERFVVGGNDTLKRQQFRLPPPQNATTCLRLTFVIPSGVTLNIRHMTARYENDAQNVDGGLRLDAHGAFFYYPEHTRKAFELEAVCGASSIITIPKRSSDGVWFCFHDDYFPGDSNRLRKNVDGSWVAIPSTEAHYGQSFHDVPYSQLCEYRVRRDGWSALERICLLGEFFSLCAKQGIHPVLSFHPLYSDMIDGVREYARDAAEIKALAKRYGVLGMLSIKVGSGATTNWTATDPVEVPLKVLFGIFGNEIEGYIVTIEQNENQVDAIDRTATVFNALRQADDPLTAEDVIEMYENKATAANVQTILNAGYEASIVQPAETVVGIDGDSRSVFHSNDYDYWCNHGVTRFTTNKTASFGLNW